MDDGYESPENVAALIPQAEQVSDAAQPSRLRQLAIRLGLVKPTPFDVPILSPSERMALELRRQYGAPLAPARGQVNAQAPALMWPTYGQPQQQAATDPAWNDIAQEAAQRERITNELGDFSKKVLSNPAIVGHE